MSFWLPCEIHATLMMIHLDIIPRRRKVALSWQLDRMCILSIPIHTSRNADPRAELFHKIHTGRGSKSSG